jgi:peptidyl-tRNA hydrolase, PTH1 family
MNKSGLLFPSIFHTTHMQVSNMVVVCDNMDLAPGIIRIRIGGSDAGHNGLKSIISSVESKDFIRIYIGIGRPESGESVIDHVLGVPDNTRKFDEGIELASTVIMKLLDGVPIHKVMNEFNRKNIRT